MAVICTNGSLEGLYGKIIAREIFSYEILWISLSVLCHVVIWPNQF